MRRGHSFLSANEELLARYAACPTSAAVIAVQAAYLAELQAPPRPAPGAPEAQGFNWGKPSVRVACCSPWSLYALHQTDPLSIGAFTACQAVIRCAAGVVRMHAARALSVWLAQGAGMITWRPWTCRRLAQSRALTRRRRAPRTTPTDPAGAPLLGLHGPGAAAR